MIGGADRGGNLLLGLPLAADSAGFDLQMRARATRLPRRGDFLSTLLLVAVVATEGVLGLVLF